MNDLQKYGVKDFAREAINSMNHTPIVRVATWFALIASTIATVFTLYMLRTWLAC